MKYILVGFIFFFTCLSIKAGEGDTYLALSAGALYPKTLNAEVSVEKELSYGQSVAIFGEAGNHWLEPVCHMFWKGYYWDGGVNYKFPLRRYKNGMLRFRVGADCGADTRKFFFGAEAGFEYTYVFSSGVEFCIIQKNNFNFLHAARDHFRNGLLIGFKFPL